MSFSNLTRRLIAFVIACHCKSLDRDCTAANRSALRAKKAHLQSIAVSDAALDREGEAELASKDASRAAIETEANARLERERYGF